MRKLTPERTTQQVQPLRFWLIREESGGVMRKHHTIHSGVSCEPPSRGAIARELICGMIKNDEVNNAKPS
jgi:hypothetical protein